MKRTNKLKQPTIRQYIHRLHHNDNFGIYAYKYDDKSCALLDELFKLLEQITPVSENGARELWLTAERGTIDDFCDLDEMLEYGEYESKEEAIETWEWMFPDEIAWYNFAAVDTKDDGYRSVFLCHRCAIVQDNRRELMGYETDISEFMQWLVDSVKDCIQQLRDGTYNEYIEKNLPPEHRTGTIRRKDYWDVWPEHREKFFKDISDEDVAEFIKLASSQPEYEPISDKRLKSMTANDFFRFCAMGYAANNYDGCDKTPKEQYYLHADGRDDGLSKIDADSEEAFDDWLHNRERGGHPWEICRGGNSTHISLAPIQDEKGFHLSLNGDAWTRTIETVKFYLALIRADIPVRVGNAHHLAERLAETELIGIVPEGVFPAYCGSYFPDEDIIDYMNLPFEDTEKFLPFCHWQPIERIKLIEPEGKESTT